MPNMPYYGYQNNYNDPNVLSVYLEIKNKLMELDKKIKDLETRINLLESKNNSSNNKSFEYETSMSMM